MIRFFARWAAFTGALIGLCCLITGVLAFISWSVPPLWIVWPLFRLSVGISFFLAVLS